MLKYDLDLDYTIPRIDITTEELRDIIADADNIIEENNVNEEKLAKAYLKKAQCMQKLEEDNHHFDFTAYFIAAAGKENTLQQIIKAIIEKSLEIFPNMPETVMQMGKAYTRTGDKENYADAATMYSKAIELKPDYAAVYNNRGILYTPILPIGIRFKPESIFNPNIELAIADFTEAIRLRPYNAIYYNNRGRAYMQFKEQKKASSDFSNALKYGSDSFKKQIYHFYLKDQSFLTYKALEDYEKAINDFYNLEKQEEVLINAFTVKIYHIMFPS